MRVTGKSRSANTERMTPPTCPVAPTIPTSTASGYLWSGGWLVELEVGVERVDCSLDVARADHTADADRRRGDHLDVHALAGEHPEDSGGDAGVGLHARAYDADAADLGVVAHALGPDLRPELLADVHGRGQVGSGHGEGDVGGPACRRVL